MAGVFSFGKSDLDLVAAWREVFSSDPKTTTS